MPWRPAPIWCRARPPLRLETLDFSGLVIAATPTLQRWRTSPKPKLSHTYEEDGGKVVASMQCRYFEPAFQGMCYPRNFRFPTYRTFAGDTPARRRLDLLETIH